MGKIYYNGRVYGSTGASARGPKGETYVPAGEITDDYKLKFTTASGLEQEVDVSALKGVKGDKGDDGMPGNDGRDGDNGDTYIPANTITSQGKLRFTSEMTGDYVDVDCSAMKGDKGDGVTITEDKTAHSGDDSSYSHYRLVINNDNGATITSPDLMAPVNEVLEALETIMNGNY